MFVSQTLSGDCAPFCSHCAQRRSFTKQQIICQVHCPSLLLIHLKRFSATGAKIDRVVEIPNNLKLANSHYQLHGVIVHHGQETDNGHYMTFIRQSKKHLSLFSDSNIIDQILDIVAHESELSLFAYLCLYMQVPPPQSG